MTWDRGHATMRVVGQFLLTCLLSVLLIVALYSLEYKLVADGLSPDIAKAATYGIFAVFMIVALAVTSSGNGPEAGA